MGLSFANMLGRLAFGGLSDKLGRKLTFAVFGLSIPLTASLPTLTAMVGPESSAPLVLFCGASVVIVSFYGAVFAVLPAYVADTFGQGYVGTIFGRVLTGLPAAALIGPSLLAFFRARASETAIRKWRERVSLFVLICSLSRGFGFQNRPATLQGKVWCLGGRHQRIDCSENRDDSSIDGTFA